MIKHNFAEVGRKLKSLIEGNRIQLDNKLEEVLYEQAQIIRENAVKKAPTDTGQLRNSIFVKKQGRGVDVSFTIGSSLDYALYVEYGTGKYASNGQGRRDPWVYKDKKTGKFFFTEGIKPQPYLNPAFNQQKEEVQKKILEVMGVWWE